MSKVQLTISMLVCGRDTTFRCLESLKPIMEQISSELILIDTGCSEELLTKLREYTGQIYPFTWCCDFSKARNEGIRRANGEWFIYIDDDEWFENPEVLIDFFKSGTYKKYGCANYIQRNFYDPDFIHYDDFWTSRMIRLDEDTHFESKIHEYLYPVRGEAYNLPLIANHTGYIFQTEEDKRKHFNRNASLLLEMISQEPERLRWRVQLMQEYRTVKEYQKLYDLGIESLAFVKSRDSYMDNRDIGTFYAGAAEGKLFLQDYEESIRITKLGLSDKRMSEMCQAYLYLCRATIFFRQKKWTEAEQAIRVYFDIYESLRKNEIRFANQKGALLVGEAFDMFPMQRAYSILCICELMRGETSHLMEYVAKFHWDKKRVYVFEGFMEALIERMANLPFQEEFEVVLQQIWDNSILQQELIGQVKILEQKDDETAQRILRLIASLKGEQQFIHYARIQAAEQAGDEQGLEAELTEYLTKSANIFSIAENVRQIMQRHGCIAEAAYLKIPFDTWCRQLSVFLSTTSYQLLLAKKYELMAIKRTENIRYEYMELCYAELEVLYSVREQEYTKKKQFLIYFAEKATAFIGKYYQEDIIYHFPELLPIYGQLAMKLAEALAVEEDDLKRALELYREMALINPQWADALKSYMQELANERKRREETAKEEMKQLEEKVMQEILTLVKDRKYEEAITILHQLQKMKPNDLDLAEMALQIRLAQLQ